MKILDLDHFLKAHEMLASYYGTQAPSLPGITLAYKSMMQEAPDMTVEQFDYALQKTIVRCRFHPRVLDFLEELYEPDMSNAPAMPDIDPRYADSYQLSVYHKAAAAWDKYKLTAPRNTKIFRDDRWHEIPGLPANKWATPLSPSEGDRPRALDAAGSGSTDNFLGF